MKLFLASGNTHKAGELQSLADARGLRVEIVSAAAVGGLPPVVEDAGTFAGNARKKALALRTRLPAEGWALAHDSGLCVDALGGAPGVESAYYAGPQGDSAANLEKLVEAMRPAPDAQRGAHFMCVLVLAGPAGELVLEGRCDGRLLREPRGEGGFGYDPLFVPEGYTQSFSEIGREIKNRLSHRARAWEKLVEWLREKQ
jgi:XTP/dITP diphosphohydrolase